MEEQQPASGDIQPRPLVPAQEGAMLSGDVQRIIVEAIKIGAYDYLAAEAAGISDRVFRSWLEQGEQAEKEGIDNAYRAFFYAVRQARAEARIHAEQRLYTDDAFKWLRYGPGRERPGRPGWTDDVQVTGADAGPVDVVIRTVWGRNERQIPRQEESEPAVEDVQVTWSEGKP